MIKPEDILSNLPEVDTKTVSRRAYIGFTIFDIIHVICSVTMLVIACIRTPIDELVVAECNVEIIFALLLVTFITALAKPDKHHESFHGLYTFAWLVALASIFTPASFMIPYIIVMSWSGIEAVSIAFEGLSILLCFASALAMFLAIRFSTNSVHWKKAIRIGLILTLIFTTVAFVTVFLVRKEPWEIAIEGVKSLAPLPPAILGLTLSRNSHFTD